MSLKPVKSGRRHRTHAPRLEGGNWGAKKKGEFTDFHKWGKVAILGTIIILGVLASTYAYYSNVYLPSLPPSPNYDPFTLLWNGTVTQGSGQGNSVMWSNANAPTDVPSTGLGELITRYAECFNTASSTQTLNRFSISLKRIGSPTGFLTGRFWDNGIIQNVNHNCLPNSLGWTDSSSATVDLSTVPTSYTTYTFNLNAPVVASNTAYAVGIWLSCTPACSDTNEVVAGISATAPASQNAATFDQFVGWSCAKPGAPGCPTTYDYQFSVFFGFSCASGYLCQNTVLSSTGNLLGLQANATSPGLALTKSPIDIATSSAKELFMYETWHNTTLLSKAQPWGWFLTQNATLPSQAQYSPLNDSSVILAIVVYPNVGATSKNYYEYLSKTTGQSLLASSGLITNPYPSCPQSSTLYLCAGAQAGASGTNFFAISTTLNYTGNAGNVGNNGFSLLCADTTPVSNPPTSNFCSSATQTPTLSPCGSATQICATTTLPFLNIQNGPYYLGFWSSPGQNATIQFGTSNSGAAAQRANSVWYWVPNPVCPPTCAVTDTSSYGGWLGKTLGGAFNAAAGVLAPITAPIFNAGNSLMNAVASALIQAGNLLIRGLVLLEGLIQSVMNLIGNAVGLGNVGTSFFTIINAVVTFFAGPNFPSLFTNAPTLFTTITNELAIFFPWIPTVITTASSIVALGTNSIGFFITIIGFMFTFVSGAFATYLIAFWFVYTGDDSLAGILGLFETTEYLVVGLGLNYLAKMINFALDVVTNLIGMIPKPFIQMVAHEFPRIPGIEVNARFVWPGGSMTEIKNGNMLAAACWVTGILFLDMYETANPALPGSIGFLLPSALSALLPMAGFIPLLEIMTAFVWGAAFLMMPIHWLSNAFDFGEVPFDSAVGTRISGGLGGIRITKATKHFQGRLEKKIAKRQALKSQPQALPENIN